MSADGPHVPGSTPERRLTPMERQHEALLAAISRPVRADHPAIRISQVKGVGGTTVHEWDVSVPVCDEYPTASEALTAALDFARMLKRAYPPPDPTADDIAANAKRQTRVQVRSA